MCRRCARRDWWQDARYFAPEIVAVLVLLGFIVWIVGTGRV